MICLSKDVDMATTSKGHWAIKHRTAESMKFFHYKQLLTIS